MGRKDAVAEEEEEDEEEDEDDEDEDGEDSEEGGMHRRRFDFEPRIDRSCDRSTEELGLCGLYRVACTASIRAQPAGADASSTTSEYGTASSVSKSASSAVHTSSSASPPISHCRLWWCCDWSSGDEGLSSGGASLPAARLVPRKTRRPGFSSSTEVWVIVARITSSS